MWLLDANMPVQLVALLKDLGVDADSAVARGWNTLSNGSLVAAAAQAKFTGNSFGPLSSHLSPEDFDCAAIEARFQFERVIGQGSRVKN